MTRQPHKFAKADDCEKGKKMTSLIEKFRNTNFPNWMRGIKAANDNMPPVSRNIYHTYNNFFLYERRGFEQQQSSKDTDIAALMPGYKVKLRLPISLKRRLRRDKEHYQKVREWLDEMEQSVNQDFFGDNADEC